jgi:hypothetical protein
MKNEQHREDTKYVKWGDGMYVMLDDLLCDYEAALVENSLRDSVYLTRESYFNINRNENCIGVQDKDAGMWWSEDCEVKLTRAQALYIATGDTDI